jgi:hypothetical protein
MTPAGAALRGMGSTAHLAGPTGWVAYVPVVSLLAFAASCVVFAWWSVRRSDGGADDPDDGETGGGGWGRGPTPTCPRPDGEPDWWPEFERQFAAYVGDRRSPALARRDPYGAPE